MFRQSNPPQCIHPQCAECEKERIVAQQKNTRLTGIYDNGYLVIVYRRPDGSYYLETTKYTEMR